MTNPSPEELLYFFHYAMKQQNIPIAEAAAEINLTVSEFSRLLSDPELSYRQALAVARALNCRIDVGESKEAGTGEYSCKSFSPFSR